MPVLYPFLAIETAIDAVTIDFPTPPFPLITPITCFMLEKALLSFFILSAALSQPLQSSLLQPELLHELFSAIYFNPLFNYSNVTVSEIHELFPSLSKASYITTYEPSPGILQTLIYTPSTPLPSS